MSGIETEGWAEKCAGKSPKGTAFTAPTRSYGNQCEENAPRPLNVASSYTPGARCSARHSPAPSLNAHVRRTVTPRSAAASKTSSTSQRNVGDAPRTMR